MGKEVPHVETMFSARKVPWHGIGTVVEEAPTAEEAIKLAGLDWQVVQAPVFCGDFEAKDALGNIRERINPETGELEKSLLGIVSRDYHPVQNSEAFDFFDTLIGEEAHYETAGSLHHGKRIFLTAKMERRWTVGDDGIDTFLLLTNGHDGRHSLRAMVTPVRVVCQNTLNIAIKKVKRSWSIPHYRTIKDKIAEARQSLGLTVSYMDSFSEFGNRAIDTKVTPGVMEGLVDELFRNTPGYKTSEKTIEKKISIFEDCLRAPDLRPYAGTMWGVLNAVSDYETHRGKQLTVFKRVLNENMSKLSKAQKFLLDAAMKQSV